MSALAPRRLGATGLEVFPLGLGAGPLGDLALPEARVQALLDAALEAGVNLIDTARSYGASEDRLGRLLGARRSRVILSTKVGYGVAGVADWTGAAVARGIDEALARLRTDYLDIVHLHSCPRATLERGEVLEALLAAVAAGKVRVPAYSGDNGDLAFAIDTGVFRCVQTSVSFLDGWSAAHVLERARTKGLGVLAKRSLANAPWRFAATPEAEDLAEYWRRLRACELDPGELSWPELALRFAVHHPLVDCALVGTVDGHRLAGNVALAGRGRLPAELGQAIGRALTAAAARPGVV